MNTPGPWHAMPFKDGETVYAADNHRVAECFATGKHGVQHEANARLIAASPELLRFAEMVMTQATGDLSAEAFRCYVANQANVVVQLAKGNSH